MIKNPRIIVLLFTLMAMLFVFYKLFIEKKATLESAPNKNKEEIQLPNKSVPAAERFIKQILKDSTSYQSINWTDLADRDSIYYVTNTFKSKNAANEFIVETYGFRVGKNGNILGFDILPNKP